MRQRRAADAREFLAGANFVWHQRFELAEGVYTPGVNDMSRLLGACRLPNVQGLSVLDIGTCNGAACFMLERQGAKRVVGVDIWDDEWFGFAAIREFMGSSAEYIHGSVYDLDSVLDEKFDVVLFLGVLYHLRHPLLSLDVLRSLTGQYAVIETQVCDATVSGLSEDPLIRFYRADELGGDRSNWFAPTHRALLDWCASCGFEVIHQKETSAGERFIVGLRPLSGDPEYRQGSYETRLRVVANQRHFAREQVSR